MKAIKPIDKTISKNNSSFLMSKFNLASFEINKKLTMLNYIKNLLKQGLYLLDKCFQRNHFRKLLQLH